MVSLSFSDFPEDIQICVLSFLSPSDLSIFACTSKRFVSLCRNDNKLWYSMCLRRWGPKTQINKWGGGKIVYKRLYRTLNKWDNLIGFWRRCGDPNLSQSSPPPPPPLIYFEWGPSFLTASRVSPSQNGSYQVIKSPFLFMGISPDGEILNYLDIDSHSEILGDFVNFSQLGFLDKDLISVNVSFMGNEYLMVEENKSIIKCEKNGIRRSSSSTNLVGEESEDVIGGTSGSLPDRLVSELYVQMANKTSPGAEWRRQRRKEKERLGRKKWETEHFVKIVNCSPSSSRPLQGLWKGICDDMNLDFYVVAYDEIGGIICRRVGDLLSCSVAPVFWTSNATFIESPFPAEEENIYDGRIHLLPPAAENHIHGQHHLTDIEVVSRILHVSSSYELVIPALAGTSVNPQLGDQGRIWQYKNGTFGFGFLRDNFIIDLKCIVQDGCLLDTMERCSE